jgi:5'-nucleotidase
MKRRNFLKNASAAGLILANPSWPVNLLAEGRSKTRITILHTNDVHSRIEPFDESSGKYAGLGGCARRAALIKQIRQEEEHVLLLDAGDILQGTPYFNLYKGELDFKLMNSMGYDAATIGNHDFDAGIEKLAENLDIASFEMLNSNYIIAGTPLESKVQPYKVFTFNDVRVGVFGVGIGLDGLVPKLWYGNVVYTDPVAAAERISSTLRKKERCDYVICLSHLGYDYRSKKICDTKLAQSTTGIDLIIGGHTHSFLDIPDVRRNMEGESVVIAQVGWAGIKLGRLDVEFTGRRRKKCADCNNIWVGELGRSY